MSTKNITASKQWLQAARRINWPNKSFRKKLLKKTNIKRKTTMLLDRRITKIKINRKVRKIKDRMMKTSNR